MVRGPRTAMKSGPCLPQLEKALTHRNEDPTQSKKKKSGFSSEGGMRERALDISYLVSVLYIILGDIHIYTHIHTQNDVCT